MKANKQADEIREQFRKGLTLSFKKLVKQKSLTGGFIVVPKNGKIVKIKATDLL